MAVKISSGSKIPPLKTPVDVMKIGSPGMPGELIIYNGKLYLYSATGETLIDEGIIQTAAILANSITANKLTIGSQQFTHNITWTAVTENKCSWSSGTIKWADGTTSNILSGDTGNITLTTYIYYDGTTILKTTTNSANAISDTKTLLAIIEVGGVGGKCIITPLSSNGTTIDGNKIVTGKIQSIDGRTYFDLNNGQIMMADLNNNNRLVIGKLP